MEEGRHDRASSVVCILGAALLCLNHAVAADTQWTGAAGDRMWTTAGNWTLGVPGASDKAQLYNVGYDVKLTMGAPNVSYLDMGGTGKSSTLNINVGRQSAGQHWATTGWAARGSATT